MYHYALFLFKIDDLTTSESSEGEIDSDHNLVGVNDEDQIIEEVDDDDDDEDCNEENDEESEVDGSMFKYLVLAFTVLR